VYELTLGTVYLHVELMLSALKEVSTTFVLVSYIAKDLEVSL